MATQPDPTYQAQPELAGATVWATEQRGQHVLVLHTDRGTFCITAWAWSDAFVSEPGLRRKLDVGLSIEASHS